jgi:hypothetical protein
MPLPGRLLAVTRTCEGASEGGFLYSGSTLLPPSETLAGADLMVKQVTWRHPGLVPSRGQAARAGVTRVGARLLDSLARDRVLLQDLADHAPINYVSAMARSFGTASHS